MKIPIVEVLMKKFVFLFLAQLVKVFCVFADGVDGCIGMDIKSIELSAEHNNIFIYYTKAIKSAQSNSIASTQSWYAVIGTNAIPANCWDERMHTPKSSYKPYIYIKTVKNKATYGREIVKSLEFCAAGGNDLVVLLRKYGVGFAEDYDTVGGLLLAGRTKSNVGSELWRSGVLVGGDHWLENNLKGNGFLNLQEQANNGNRIKLWYSDGKLSMLVLSNTDVLQFDVDDIPVQQCISQDVQTIDISQLQPRQKFAIEKDKTRIEGGRQIGVWLPDQNNSGCFHFVKEEILNCFPYGHEWRFFCAHDGALRVIADINKTHSRGEYCTVRYLLIDFLKLRKDISINMPDSLIIPRILKECLMRNDKVYTRETYNGRFSVIVCRSASFLYDHESLIRVLYYGVYGPDGTEMQRFGFDFLE